MRPFSGIFVFTLTAILTLAIIRTLNITLPISVTTRTVSGELSVVGEGKVDVIPDTASVSVGIVVSDAKTIQEAEKGINEVNNKIIAALKKLGISDKDIKTTNYSITPNYNYEGGKNTITGYYASATLSIKVRKPENLPRVITTATEAGANQIYGAEYTIDNPDKYREEARNKAIENAKGQAKKLASALGIKLGKIVNIVESTPSDGPISTLRQEAGLGGPAAPEIQPGTQTITSQVTLFFEKR